MAETYVVPQDYRVKDVLWVSFQARELLQQNSYARGDNTITAGSWLATFWFLAPNEISENIAHEWGEYESVGSRVAGKVGDIKKGINEAKGMINAAGSGYESMKGGSGGTVAAKDLMSSLVGGSQVAKYKIDSSYVYKNSQRREFSMTFHFAYTYGDSNAQSAVFAPIRKLEELSCPELGEGLVDLKFPALFRVMTIPPGLIQINHAVLTAVQPTWHGPYIEGYPIYCELQLTFVDMEPLYRQSLSEGGIIDIGEVGG